MSFLETGDIETSGDWWQAVDHHWDDFIITAGRLGYYLDRSATDTLRNDGQPLACTFLEDFTAAKRRRDWKRVRQYLQAFWDAAPDARWIHDLPSWGVLCDLCSESWVFNKPEQEDD